MGTLRHALSLLLLVPVAAGCKPPVVSISETPIKISRETQGYGDPAGPGDRVIVDYRITLPDGTEVLRQKAYQFTVDTNSVIRGIDEAIVGMKAGGTRFFTCPPHKHWGRAGYGNGLIPPATDLYIELRLESIQNRAQQRVGVAAGKDSDQ